jgi:2-amino-4-hydroxy-6-hydroxymethyldihydropteridine diphosphokinase
MSNSSLSLYKIANFPSKFTPSKHPFSVTIGFGGNIGNMNRRFKKLYNYLLRHPHIDIVQTSPLLQNPPFGYLEQADFINGVMLIQTSLYPTQLLDQLQHIEKIFGRIRTFSNAPRTLDLDIIFFESKKLYNKRLIIPHPDWQNRQSVIAPLGAIHKRLSLRR